jgi:hypothetical protein
LGLRGGCPYSDLEPIDKLYALDDLWQLVMAIEPSPGFLRTVDQLEDHGERGFVGQAPFGSDGAVADGREGAFDRVCRSQMLPMLGREVVAGEQRLAVLILGIRRLYRT